MERVKKMIEDYPKLLERKQILHSRLLTLGGRNPILVESLLFRLEEIEQKEELITDMIYESTSLTLKDSCILEMRSTGHTLAEIGQYFSLSRERIRNILEESYKKLAIEFKDDLSGC